MEENGNIDFARVIYSSNFTKNAYFVRKYCFCLNKNLVE